MLNKIVSAIIYVNLFSKYRSKIMTDDLKSGTYSTTVKNMGQDMRVDVQIDQGKIAGVKVNVDSENPYANVVNELEKEVITKQGDEIDAIAGATVTSNAIKNAVKKIMAEAKIAVPVENPRTMRVNDVKESNQKGSNELVWGLETLKTDAVSGC